RNLADLNQSAAELHPAELAGSGLSPNLAGEEVCRPQLPGDRLQSGAIAKLLRTRTGDDLQRGESRQLAPNLVGNTIGEVLVLRATVIGKRKHRDVQRCSGNGFGWTGPAMLPECEAGAPQEHGNTREQESPAGETGSRAAKPTARVGRVAQRLGELSSRLEPI